MYTILVCDDEKDIVNALGIYLRAEGYHVVEAYNGQEAVDLLDREAVDLVVMDIMMPVLDGISAMKMIRETSVIPIILLTAMSEDEDKVLGLDVGADDYVTKPFNPDELLARVRSQLRRFYSFREKEPLSIISCGDIEMNDRTKEVSVTGEHVKLTPTEYEILKLLLSSPGKVYSIHEIYESIWEDVSIGAQGSIPVHVRHLREKIEIDPANPRYLKVVWGQGYRIEKGEA